MPPDYNEPTAAEWKVLTAMRNQGPLPTREVIQLLAESGEDWSDSTVKTLLRRLTEKGALRTRQVGNSFVYSTTRTPWSALRRAGETLLERAGEGATAPLLAHLLKRGGLGREELDDLRRLIDKLSGDESS